MKNSLFRRLPRLLPFVWLGLLAATVHAGSVARLYYDNLSSSSSLNSFRIGLASLTNAARFPADPSFREQLDDFSTLPGVPLRAGLQGKDNSGTDYGSWVRGFIEAPTTGDYIFGLASDDNGALFLSTDHAEENKRLIAFESDAGGSLFGGARLNERNSQPVSLVKGRKYYFEVLHKQAGGGAFLQVGWQRPDGVQEIIPALHLAQFPVDPFLGRFNTNQPPIFNPAGLNGGNLPAAVTLDEGSELLLELDVIAAQPTTVQWSRNGSVIEGQNLAFLRVPRVSASWNGARIAGRVENAFGVATSSNVVLTVRADTTPPTVASVETVGNPNTLNVTFSEPVAPESAVLASNYRVRTAAGAVLPVQTAKLQPGDRTVVLTGAFGFRAGESYQVTVSGVADQSVAGNRLAPDPTTTSFTFSSPVGTTYSFNSGKPEGFRFFGNSDVVPSGSHDGSGFLQLTDAFRNRNSAVLITERRNVDQIRLRFKARFADGGATTGVDEPGDGFSINIAGDLPLGNVGAPENGFIPFAPGSRLSFTFDTHADGSGDSLGFGVVLNSVELTNILAGVGGVPAITRADGRWVDVDIDLRRNGRLTLKYDGVTILNNFPTAFETIPNAQVNFAARTRSWYQTHWIDDLNINYSEGDFGEVGLSSESVIGGVFPEGTEVRLAAQPTGAGPFLYQWIKNNAPIPGATNRILRFPAELNAGGNFAVRVANDFSEIVSPAQRVQIQPDSQPPTLVEVRGVAGGVNRVLLRFDELLDPVTATDPAAYASPFFKVTSAALGADGRSVILQTTPQRSGTTYRLDLRGIKDRSTAANARTDSASFLSTITYQDEVLGDDPVRYFKFEETTGTVASTELASGDTVNTNGTYLNLPLLGVPGLVPSAPSGRATRFVAAETNYVSVPNGGDINDFRGPWSKRTIEFWFRAETLPATNLTGLAATAGLYEEGGNLRSIHVHLWRDPSKLNPNEAELVFHAFNDTSDGPGAPFGLRGAPPIYLQHTIKAKTLYHVVAVFDGRTDSFDGELVLYVNGEVVGRKGGIGQIYNHNGDVRIGSGNARIFLNLNGAFGSFDGVIDDLSIYNSALAVNRVRAHYLAGIGASLVATNPPTLVLGASPRGNPNSVSVTFSQPVSEASAKLLSNYAVETAAGAALPLASASLADDLVTVRLSGAFGFAPNGSYRLRVRGVADILVPDNVVAETVIPFTFTSAGPVTLDPASDLGDRQIVENARTTLSALAKGEPPYLYQWLFEGAPLAGETNRTLVINGRLGASGTYSVVVSNEFSSVTSPGSRVAVVADSEPPRLLRAQGLAGSLNEVRLGFSEPLERTSAESIQTYVASGLSVQGVTLSADGATVTLKTSPQTHGQSYQVSFTGLKDRAGTPNSLTGTAGFTSSVSYRDEVLAESAVRYWPFNERDGSEVATLVSRFDQTRANVVGVASGGTTLGVPGLVPNLPGDTAFSFSRTTENIVSAPNGRDLNAILGPWPKRSHVFSFKAGRLPRLNGTNAEAPAIFGHGRIAFYLYGTQDVATPTEALLVFHAHNNSSEGPGSPWGGLTGNPETAKFISTPIRSGEIYHVVGVLDGDPNGFTGQLRLYVNGRPVGIATGIGQLYRHPNNQPTFGRAGFLRHDGINASIVPPIVAPTIPGEVFDGVIDEFAILDKALTTERVAQLHAFASIVPPVEAEPPTITSTLLQGGNVIIRWQGVGRLERAPEAAGPYTPVQGAVSPHSEPVSGASRQFYRVVR